MLPYSVFDIETTGLGEMAHILCVSIGECVWKNDKMSLKKRSYMLNDYPGENLYDDSVLLASVIPDLERFICVVGWYSKGFDAKFIQRRLLYHQMRKWSPNTHLDLYYVYRNQFKTGEMSCRLAAAGEFLELDTPKMIVERKIWKAAWYGDKKAMKTIKDRCESDLDLTGNVFERIHNYIRPAHYRVA